MWNIRSFEVAVGDSAGQRQDSRRGAARAMRGGFRLGIVLALGLAAIPALVRPAHADGSVIIRDFVLTRGIEAREPVDAAESFAVTDQQAYAFARIANDGQPTTVVVRWRYEDEVHAEVDLTIGTSTAWRTWSSANLKPGHWNVELIAPDGLVLAERSFTVAESVAEAPVHFDDAAGGSDGEWNMRHESMPARDASSDFDG